MKKLNLLSVLALSMLLMLGACKKNDPSTPEGKVEMAIAALKTDGKNLTSKLEAKGWTPLKLDEHVNGVKAYSKGNEECTISIENNQVVGVNWGDNYNSLSDAKKAFGNYHNASVKKHNREYFGMVRSQRGVEKNFNNPSDCMEYVNNVTENELKNGTVDEGGLNAKNDIMFECMIQYFIPQSCWRVGVAIVSVQ